MKADLEGRWAELGEFIRGQRRVTDLSLRKLAELAGVSNPYLSQIEQVRKIQLPSGIGQRGQNSLLSVGETFAVRISGGRHHPDSLSKLRPHL